MTTSAIAARVSGLAALGLVGFVACGGATAGIGTDPAGAGAGGSGSDSGIDGAAQQDEGTDASTTSDAAKKSNRIPVVHRATAVACSHDRGPGTAVSLMGGPSDCTKDADCTAGTNGRCMVTTVAARLDYCSYDLCFADSDCSGKVCTCRESASDANRCADGDCKVDADCGPGGYCSPTVAFDKINFGVTAYYCHTGADTCVDDADCTMSTNGPPGAKCAYDPSTKHWACSNMGFYPP